MARLTKESYTKIVLIILLGALLIGVAGFGTCSPFHVNFGSSNLSQLGEARIDQNEIQNIDIDWAAGSVDISVYDGKEVLVTESSTGNISKSQQMRWQVSGDTLKIDYGASFSCGFPGTKHLEIKVPKSLAQNMGTLDIDGASGDYHIKSIECESFKMTIASGKVDATDMVIGDLKVDVASGYALIEGEVSGELKTDVASGNINVVCEKIMPSSIDSDMASGTVVVSLPENEGFTAKIGKLSGHFESEFATAQNGESYVYKNGKTSIKADMASGQFILKKTA